MASHFSPCSSNQSVPGAAWVRGDDLVLDQYLVVRQVRDRAQALVLGRLLDRYALLLRPTLGLRQQLLAHGGHRYPLIADRVASPGEQDPPLRTVEGVDGALQLLGGDAGAQGDLKRLDLVGDCLVGRVDGQHLQQRAHLPTEVAWHAHDYAGGAANKRHSPLGAVEHHCFTYFARRSPCQCGLWAAGSSGGYALLGGR